MHVHDISMCMVFGAGGGGAEVCHGALAGAFGWTTHQHGMQQSYICCNGEGLNAI
jgi:hypothetical protein